MAQLPVSNDNEVLAKDGGLAKPKSNLQARQGPSLGSALLRDYRTHLDPLNTNDGTQMDREEAKELMSGISNASTQIGDSPLDVSKSLASSPINSHTSKSILSHRKGSTTLPPHRNMLKALASRSSNESLRQNKHQTHHASASLSEMGHSRTPFARFTHSPCFFHQRFDDAVNIDRVLEEIAAEDDGMSHSRLMQTATSVREISKQLQRRPIKRAVRTVMIVTKARDNTLVHLTRELTEWLLSTPRYNSDIGITVYVDIKLAKSKRFDAEGLIASNPRYESMLHYWTPDLCWSSPEKFDIVLTLGGDGTVLYTSWLFQRIVPPILSFSLGSLGFLTNFSFNNYKPALDRIMEGSGMRVNMRMRFTCTVYRSPENLRTRSSSGASLTSHPSATSFRSSTGTNPPSTNDSTKPAPTDGLIPDLCFEVLNELVLDRGPSPYVSNLVLYGDSHLLTIIQADGCIISTPTGSTAYSLSAGGPLTHPSIPGILLTPICPHTLSFRPMVLSDTLLLRLVVPRNSRSTAYASFDGKSRVELRRGDEVRVEAGRYPFPTVVGEGGTGGEWFESVRRALRWNTRGAVQGGFGGGGRMAMDGERVDEQCEADDDDDDAARADGEDWDIDADPVEGRDSGLGGSEAESERGSPMRRMESLGLD